MFIKIIDDKEIIKNDKFYTLNLSKKNSNNFITINPFRIEHYNDIDLFNLKLYCDEKNIILRVLSSMNYLPVNSQYADILVLNENEMRSYPWIFYCESTCYTSETSCF